MIIIICLRTILEGMCDIIYNKIEDYSKETIKWKIKIVHIFKIVELYLGGNYIAPLSFWPN